MSREFTAQDIREMAEKFIPHDEDDYGELVVANLLRMAKIHHGYGLHVNKLANSYIREMLRYAAGVMERCDRAIAILSKVRSAISFDCEVGSCGAYCIDSIDVIADNALDSAIDLLRGDAGKEER